jgi:hypothetical protein
MFNIEPFPDGRFMVQGSNSTDLDGGIRDGEPPTLPKSSQQAQGKPPSRLEGVALAFLLVISFLCITAFISIETFPMGRLFLLYATHGPWGDRSGWGPIAFSFGLAGIILAFASNVPARQSPRPAMKLFAWLFLLMASMLLLAFSEAKLLSLLTALPFAGASIAWFRIRNLPKGGSSA